MLRVAPALSGGYGPMLVLYHTDRSAAEDVAELLRSVLGRSGGSVTFPPGACRADGTEIGGPLTIASQALLTMELHPITDYYEIAV